MSSTRARFPSASVSCSSALPAPPLVPPDPGDLLEQRPPLLGAECERLVDHALADEQERVLREVRAVQQVDEVAQPHALAVEEVVVLARAVEAPAELDHAVLDRQQGVAVVEHERHVGHALGRPLLGARPDHVLGAPDPERSPLLAQRPAERVGEVGLARSVGPDDGADARAELHQRALGERLEPLDAQPEQPGRGGHEPSPSRRPTPRPPPANPRRRPRPRRPRPRPRQPRPMTPPSRRATPPAPGAARRAPGRPPTSPRCGATGPRPRRAFARHLDLDPELLLVVGSDRLDQPVERPLAGRPLGVLLEPALGALERRDRVVGGQLLRRQLVDPVARGVPAEVEVDRPDEGLERGRQQGRPDAAAALRLAFAEQQVRAELEPGGQPGEAGRAHDRGAARGQHALVVGRVAPVQGLGDGEADDGVAEELEPLVVTGRGVRVLVQPAAVDERLGQQVAVVDGKPEALRQGVGRVHRAPGRAI